ncbi:MAG: glutaredoxin domain-containing protein [Nocardioides sp.]|nr:glutaredoxin domain-containing protein [Nocardioides sp.]
MSEQVEVLWRPGCLYCRTLRSELRDRGVEATWRNIWSDAEARELVRAANGGAETVPTVRVGETWLTNPTWRDLAPLLGRDWQEPVQPSAAAASYASPGASGPDGGLSPGLALGRALALVVFLSLGFMLLARDLNVAGVLALLAGVAVWTLTRPPTDTPDDPGEDESA